MAPKPDHLIVLMMENRSFDHMFGFMGSANYAIDGLTGNEFNLDSAGKKWPVTKNAIYTGGLPPAFDGPPHDCADVLAQIAEENLGANGGIHPMSGFVRTYEKKLAASKENPAFAPNVMNCFDPARIPVLTTLAQQYAVCDRWFASLPSQTLPNRLFAHTGSSGGGTDVPPIAAATTLFEVFADQDVDSAIFAGNGTSMTGNDYLFANSDEFIKSYDDFRDACRRDKLPRYSFIEPIYHPLHRFEANDQHPDNDVRLGERLIKDVYDTIRANDAVWKSSMLLIVYDEHGGLYDHVSPPAAIAPDNAPPMQGDPPFDFKRYGPRVPAVLISPYVAPGSIFPARADLNRVAYDHTSIIATACRMFSPNGAVDPRLGKRAQAAGTFEDWATLSVPRDDHPLESLAPQAQPMSQNQQQMLTQIAATEQKLPWHLQTGVPLDSIQTDRDAGRYISHVMRNLSLWRSGNA